jgi:pseudouridine-5'-phosphate glycosidase
MRTADLFDKATFQPTGLALSEEVEHALQHGKPVVALETAILTHGMPPPTNVETCLLVERRVRESGAIPATIGSM